jgi:phosphopantothenoylcysteine decarboxylase/phosphopantothenate--cysteine ligase
MKLLICVTGGIAAYKALELVRLFVKAKHEVQVVMTEGAKQFIQPLSFQALSGNPVRDSLFDSAQEAGMGHIELARWADLIMIAPTTAETIAKLRMGRADDLLTTLCLATTKPIMLVPAMNSFMWNNEATVENIKILKQRGMLVLTPASGEQACGEVGVGRMPEPQAIFDKAVDLLTQETELKNYWQGKKVLITAGPTFEEIDPVRFIGNRSSGKMGFAIATQLAKLGAEVTLISGVVNLDTPALVQRINVRSAEQMFNQVKQHLDDKDYFIGSAAVADYRVVNPKTSKIKKTNKQEKLTIELEKNPDIITWVTQNQIKTKVIGFAAETENVLDYAKQKLANKNLEMVCANLVASDKGFDKDYNQLTLISKTATKALEISSKSKQALELLAFIAKENI